ncbi:MAG: DUF4926 domain-containing protein [Kofleriaceae bacterium]|nr:DUF4926 domain-containing protein [Kofleriaceae bacterium]
MHTFELFAVVRVSRLLRAGDDDYDDWATNVRPPRPGDVATIVDVLAPDRFVVELVNDVGATEWVSDLTADELEPFVS